MCIDISARIYLLPLDFLFNTAMCIDIYARIYLLPLDFLFNTKCLTTSTCVANLIVYIFLSLQEIAALEGKVKFASAYICEAECHKTIRFIVRETKSLFAIICV